MPNSGNVIWYCRDQYDDVSTAPKILLFLQQTLEKDISSSFSKLRFADTNLTTYARTHNVAQPSGCRGYLKAVSKSSYINTKRK